jgi:mono/diheme cytochrome c family protein
MRVFGVGLFASILIVAAASSASAQTADKSSAAPTDPAVIAHGDSVFHGAGNCYACHGSKAEGVIGPNLTDAEWIHSKGTYQDIVNQVNHGVPKEESKSGVVMPPRGGATLTDDDVKAVAAYVYSLGHK